MRIKYDIEQLKQELVGINVNWLTVLDVYKNEHNRTVCKCQCKCGTIKEYPLKVIKYSKIKSCGCFHHSKEFSDKCRQWYKDNPEKVKDKSEKYKQWCNDNKDKIKEQSERHKEFFKNSPDLIEQNRQRMIQLNMNHNKEQSRLKRIESIKKIIEDNYDYISDKIYIDDLNKLISGELISTDKIKTACPQCGKFSEHNVRDIFNIKDSSLKRLRLCSDCLLQFSTSAYEQEIVDYISTFYNGECVRNSHTIIPPSEIDIYYPEKKIAVEFNGDYWHSSEFKSRDYHYNKFKHCLEKDIILVNIFETYWNNDKDVIKSYLKDLFSNKINDLSFIENNCLNNNYPTYNLSLNDVYYIEHCYTFKDIKVYTAGFSKITKPL